MEKYSFEEAMQRLNEIVSQLEKNEVPLEKSISLFEEGLSLVQLLDGQLKGFEAKVEELMQHHQNDTNE